MRTVRAAWSFLAGVALAACRTHPGGEAPPAAQDGGVHGVPVEGGSCRSNAECPADELCEFTRGLCGKERKPGGCRPKPTACDEPYSPVCGCDGKVYDGACSARAAAVDVAATGGCKETIPDWITCGGRYCDARTSYCEIFLSDVQDPPTDYFCRLLPPSCLPATDGAARSCDCFPAGTRCGTFCGPLPTGSGKLSGFHLTCQGRRTPTE